jgi:hypothetical protein
MAIWPILRPSGMVFYGHLAYFTAIWYDILWPFGIFYGYLVFFLVLVCCTKKYLATLAITCFISSVIYPAGHPQNREKLSGSNL